MKVAINTSGFFAPFSKMCGAAETLVGDSVLQNEIEGDRELQLYGVADETALAEEPMDCIVFDNSPMLLMALRVKGNRQRYAKKEDVPHAQHHAEPLWVRGGHAGHQPRVLSGEIYLCLERARVLGRRLVSSGLYETCERVRH